MARQHVAYERGAGVDDSQPPTPIPIDVDGEEHVVYVADSDEADAAMPADTLDRVLALAGAGSDLEWDEVSEALDRIRHDSTPTPPIDNRGDW